MPAISQKTLSNVGAASMPAMAATARPPSLELSMAIHLTPQKSGQ